MDNRDQNRNRRLDSRHRRRSPWGREASPRPHWDFQSVEIKTIKRPFAWWSRLKSHGRRAENMADHTQPEMPRECAVTSQSNPSNAKPDSTPETSAPMLDVHAPHETIRTWKNFLTHIAAIVVGLIIAVSLEQTVEFFHHHHQRE